MHKASDAKCARALNAHPEAVKNLGLSKARHIGYNTALTAHDLKDSSRDEKEDLR
jgi:hypothetical protein